MRGLITNITGLTLTVAVSSVALAEPYGLLNGRSADLSRAPDRSIEAGAVFGEFDDVDYEHLGARFNYKLNPTTVIYGDFGQTDVDISGGADGTSFGIGGFWQMDGIVATSDFAIHASYHQFDLDFDEFTNGIKGSSIVVEGLFSSKDPINQAGTMYFNGSIGLARSSIKVTDIGDSNETDTELTFSAGVVVETQSKSGEFYAGALYVDDLGFGAGYRHFLK